MGRSAPALGLVAAFALAGASAAACGETRRPIGDECLRDDDCLSGDCSARTCVGQAPRVVGTAPPATPFVPPADASDDASDDAAADGAAARDAGDGG